MREAPSASQMFESLNILLNHSWSRQRQALRNSQMKKKTKQNTTQTALFFSIRDTRVSTLRRRLESFNINLNENPLFQSFAHKKVHSKRFNGCVKASDCFLFSFGRVYVQVQREKNQKKKKSRAKSAIKR